MKRDTSNRVDPDPFTIATIGMSAAALVLQFLQTFKAFKPGTVSNPVDSMERSNLDQLERATAAVLTELKGITRNIERDLADADSEFFDTPIRIGETSMLLSQPAAQRLQQTIGTAYAAVGNLAIWVYHICNSAESCRSFRL